MVYPRFGLTPVVLGLATKLFASMCEVAKIVQARK
jgi:hypothetical protein